MKKKFSRFGTRDKNFIFLWRKLLKYILVLKNFISNNFLSLSLNDKTFSHHFYKHFVCFYKNDSTLQDQN